MQCNACRAIANSVSLHEDNQHAVAGVRGVFPALVALAATEEEMGQIHTVAALALANLTDANADNCRSGVEGLGFDPLAPVHPVLSDHELCESHRRQRRELPVWG